jgi:hypothetical protein
MREGTVRAPCALRPEELWRARSDIELDLKVAERERRKLRQIGNDESEVDDRGNSVLVRTTVLELPDDFVPRFFQKWVTYDQLSTRVTTRWHDEAYDRDHGCSVDIAFPAFADRVDMGYTQWIEPSEGRAQHCVLCTRTRISIRADGAMPQWVCSAIEKVAEVSMHNSLEQYPAFVVGHVTATTAGTARPGKARVPTDDEERDHKRPCFFCQCELLGFVRVACGKRVES